MRTALGRVVVRSRMTMLKVARAAQQLHSLSPARFTSADGPVARSIWLTVAKIARLSRLSLGIRTGVLLSSPLSVVLRGLTVNDIGPILRSVSTRFGALSLVKSGPTCVGSGVLSLSSAGCRLVGVATVRGIMSAIAANTAYATISGDMSSRAAKCAM